jgi:tRNA nucleotidyltransferase (CCA-adding enzyme)
MKKYLKGLPLKINQIIAAASRVCVQVKMPAYLVGGFVRDLILGVKNFDLDIVVCGDGIGFAQALAKELKSTLKVHERFRTATLIKDGLLKVDIATTRKEAYPVCGCLPIVSAGSLRDDLKRRDFTINAMAISISKGSDQELIDPFNGRDDLSAGKIRVLHDLSFRDDPTRILRAIRFKQRFNFKIEPKTLLLLKAAARNKLLDKVNLHRIRDELILMLKESDPRQQIDKLDDLCILSFISKNLILNRSVFNLFRSVDRQISWFTKNCPKHRLLDPWLIYFTVLLLPLTLNEIKKVIFKLGLQRGQASRIISYFELRGKIVKLLSRDDVSPAQVYFLLQPLSYETIILLKATSANKYLKKYITDFFTIYNGVQLSVGGNDLANLNVTPGPQYQRIFKKILEAKLNGRIKDRRGELDLIRKLIKVTE